jgi:hypothetical protein
VFDEFNFFASDLFKFRIAHKAVTSSLSGRRFFSSSIATASSVLRSFFFFSFFFVLFDYLIWLGPDRFAPTTHTAPHQPNLQSHFAIVNFALRPRARSPARTGALCRI